MSDKNFIWFEKISDSDKKIVGEEAFNLSEMGKSDFPVPLGFVVTHEAYGYFVRNTGLLDKINEHLDNLDIDDEEELEEISEKIRDLILETEIPESIEEEMLTMYRNLGDRVGKINPPVSLRTSVYVKEENGSFSKKEATCLGVNGEDDLLKHLKGSWAFKFSDQVLSHFGERGYDPDQVLISVSVQKMVEAEKGGVFFTSHPSPEEKNKMVVEANWGLGETVASGSVTPDTCILDKGKGVIIDTIIGSKEEMLVYDSVEGTNERKQTTTEKREAQVISEEEADKIVSLGKRLEEYYDGPREVEWAEEEGEIYLVRTKPMEFISQQTIEEGEDEDQGDESEVSTEEDYSEMSGPIISTVTDVKVNVGSPEDAHSVARPAMVGGVGLLEAEGMIMDIGKHPVRLVDEGGEGQIKERIKEGMREVLEEFSSKPVWYRTLDLGSEVFSNISGGERFDGGSNPKMGARGSRKFMKPGNVKEQEILKTELRAIRELTKEGFENIGVMISMVQDPYELQRFKRLAREVGLKPHEDFEVGIMVDLPAAALVIEEFIEEGLDFVVFDVSALTQFTLGVDKGNEEVGDIYDEEHPAVGKLLSEAIAKCRKNDVESSICASSEISSNLVSKFVKYGVKSISVDTGSLERVRRVIGKTEKEIILEKVREELNR